MQQISSLMNQILPQLSLYSEIIACLVVIGIVSLVIGWLMHGSRSKALLTKANEAWEKRYRALEEISRVDAENLEEQLQNLATETRGLQADKKLLTDSLRKNESAIQSFRAETIELNRQHAETQERLQRIIQQKDRELLELGNRLNQQRSSSNRLSVAEGVFREMDEAERSELTCADTIAINNADMLDATIQIPSEELPGRRRPPSRLWQPPRDQSDQDNTAPSPKKDVTEALEIEEATVAMDDEALAHARRSSSKKRGR